MSNDKFKYIIVFFLAFFAISYIVFQYTKYNSTLADDNKIAKEQEELTINIEKQKKINKTLDDKINKLENNIELLTLELNKINIDIDDYKNISKLSLSEKKLKKFKNNFISFLYPNNWNLINLKEKKIIQLLKKTSNGNFIMQLDFNKKNIQNLDSDNDDQQKQKKLSYNLITKPTKKIINCISKNLNNSFETELFTTDILKEVNFTNYYSVNTKEYNKNCFSLKNEKKWFLSRLNSKADNNTNNINISLFFELTETKEENIKKNNIVTDNKKNSKIQLKKIKLLPTKNSKELKKFISQSEEIVKNIIIK